MIKTKCVGCGAAFSLDDSFAGKTGKCRNCGVAITIPAVDAAISAGPATPQAQVSVEEMDSDDADTAIQITTTETIHGWEVRAYKGLVTSHVVAGTNIFYDLAAGLTDFFGGRSHIYQKQMAVIEEEAINAIRNAAISRGANWIIGTRIDFDEISGKGMQMIMVSVHGTAVTAQRIATPLSPLNTTSVLSGEIVADQLERDAVLRELRYLREHKRLISKELLVQSAELRLPEVVPLCLDVLFAKPDLALACADRRDAALNALRMAPRLSQRRGIHSLMIRCPRDERIAQLYGDLGLLDLKWVLEQVQSTDKTIRTMGLQALCRGIATVYSRADIETLQHLLVALPRAFQETCTYSDQKGFLGGPTTQIWRCEHGHDNGLNASRCFRCGIDRYGLPDGTITPPKGIEVAAATLRVLQQHFVR